MKKTIFFILITAAILVSIWFKDGNILGTAEDGLIFYNISNYYHQTEYTWMEYPGLGSPSLTLIVGKPTFFLFSYLEQIGIPGFIIQAGVMWFILISSALGIYLLTQELFPKLPSKYILLAVLFYWFNPISLVDVWNRFLLNYLFFFALIPIGSYFYIKGLTSRKYIWSFILNISLLFCSYAFSYIAFIMLFWIWLFILTVLFFLTNYGGKSKLYYLKYFFLTTIVFILINSWWILPLIKLNLTGGSNPTTNLFVNQNNLNILKALSSKMGNLTDVFRLTNASFLDTDSLGWVKLYYSQAVQILLYLITGAILYSFIKLKNEKSTLFLGSLFLLTIFLIKGNNPPFGEIYDLIFKEISVLQVFRNPFEKFGFLLSLVASILIGMSVYRLELDLKNKLKYVIYPLFFLVIFLVLGFPLYTALVFTNKFPPTDNYSIGYKVQVPSYYKEVNNYLNNMGNNFRYIGFPIKDEGVTYKWEKGYAGVELAVALYDSKGIFHNTSTPFFNKIVPNIETTLFSVNKFSNLANALNARYYLLRYDIDYKLRALTDPAIIDKTLIEKEKKGEVKKVAQFGKVSIWEDLGWRDTVFYTAQKFIKVDDFINGDLSKVNVLSGEVLIDKTGLSQIQTKLDVDTQNTAPTISYQKINPTKYILHIKNPTNPFLLTFSELYNEGWHANYKDGGVVSDHIRLNIYANGWIIERKGEFNIEVKFTPQDWMNTGEKVSLFADSLILVALVLYFKRRKK